MIPLPRRGGLRERVFREEWNLAIIHQSVDDIVKRGIVGDVEWMPPQSPWHGFADPSYYARRDGSLALFAERLNHLTGRGEIWSADVPSGANPVTAQFHRWAVADTHLSYPFPFIADGVLYYTMENAESGCLRLWQQIAGQWREHILLERPTIDPTFWYDEHGWWLFCTFTDDQPDTKLHLFFADEVLGPWQAHPQSPVKVNEASARPAGPLFRSDGRLIRPSQDSTQTYGGALVLNTVTQLTRTQYDERPVRRLVPVGPYGHGLHTICSLGEKTLIDGKRWAFHPLDPLRYPIAGGLNYYRRHRSRNRTIRFEEA